jgi:glycerol uptake facilitator-like aquaporin
MNIGGWIILLCMWGAIIITGVFCFARILSQKNPEMDQGED